MKNTEGREDRRSKDICEERKEVCFFTERYRKKRVLGQGSRGKVWLVENVNTKGNAALKLYKRGSREAEREIQVLRQFGGRGIPYLIDCAEDQEHMGIIMEYVDGKSLRNLMEEQKIWTEESAMDTALKTAKILSLFHGQIPPMVYGDLKPENIMVTSEGEVYLIDFGSVVYEGEKDHRLFGTKAYLPPSEEGRILPYRDTYGLGVILYEMITGCRIQEAAKGKADISHLSPGCRAIMQKAVRICEREGYKDAGQMYEDLREYHEECQNKNKKGRKIKMREKRRKNSKTNYFIMDLKRMLLHGHMKLLGMMILGVFLGGFALRGRETEAAEMPRQVRVEKEIKIADNTEERAEMMTEKAEKEKAEKGEKPAEEQTGKAEKIIENAETGKTEKQPEKTVVYDEYGRKLVVRREKE